MNRGTEAVWPSEGGFTVLCDCGTSTQVVVDMKGLEPGAEVAELARYMGQEFAVTCEGCGSAHWLTLTPVTGEQQ